MGSNVLAAPVARPQNLKYCRIKRRDGLVNERRGLCQETLLLLDDRQMPIEFARLLKGPARAKAQRDVIDQRAFLCFVAVKLQAEDAEAGIVQAATHHFKGGELFGDK